MKYFESITLINILSIIIRKICENFFLDENKWLVVDLTRKLPCLSKFEVGEN